MSILDKFKNKKKDDGEEAKDLKLEEKAEVKTEVAKPVKAKKEVSEKSDVSIDKDVISAKFAGILVKPIVSEKNSNLAGLNQYVFEVSKDSNKILIGQAIKARYGIEPVRINILNILGKKVRSGKYSGKQKDVKKAVVFLPEGKSINVYEA